MELVLLLFVAWVVELLARSGLRKRENNRLSCWDRAKEEEGDDGDGGY